MVRSVCESEGQFFSPDASRSILENLDTDMSKSLVTESLSSLCVRAYQRSAIPAGAGCEKEKPIRSRHGMLTCLYSIPFLVYKRSRNSLPGES